MSHFAAHKTLSMTQDATSFMSRSKSLALELIFTNIFGLIWNCFGTSGPSNLGTIASIVSIKGFLNAPNTKYKDKQAW